MALNEYQPPWIRTFLQDLKAVCLLILVLFIGSLLLWPVIIMISICVIPVVSRQQPSLDSKLNAKRALDLVPKNVKFSIFGKVLIKFFEKAQNSKTVHANVSSLFRQWITATSFSLFLLVSYL